MRLCLMCCLAVVFYVIAAPSKQAGLAQPAGDPVDGDDHEEVDEVDKQPDGRGVFLMRKLADEVFFRDGGRCVEMRFLLS